MGAETCSTSLGAAAVWFERALHLVRRQALIEAILLRECLVPTCPARRAGVCAGPPLGGREATAAAALRHHVQAARAAPQPELGAAAMSLLSSYFQHLRATADAQQGLLASLARVAAAVARLRGSATVEAVPDAVLAVALTGVARQREGGEGSSQHLAAMHVHQSCSLPAPLNLLPSSFALLS